MMNSIEKYEEMAKETAIKLSDNENNWISFLNTAANTYKYSYRQQILIHAQYPNVRACAGQNIWQKLKRQIKNNAHNIGVINGKSIAYLYDIQETISANNDIVYIWQFQPNESEKLSSFIAKEYSLEHTEKIEYIIYQAALKLTQEYYKKNQNNIIKSCSEGNISALTNNELYDEFSDLTAASVSYLVMHRCDLPAEEMYSNDYFEDIADFDTFNSISCICDAVNIISKNILSIIEKIIKGERNKNNKSSVIEPVNNILLVKSQHDTKPYWLQNINNTPPVQSISNNYHNNDKKTNSKLIEVVNSKSDDKNTSEDIPEALEYNLFSSDSTAFNDIKKTISPIIKADIVENYCINRLDYEGGPKKRYKRNMAAISILKDIDKNNRKATREEKDILANYSGWGSLPMAFDSTKSEWNNEFTEIRNILTDDEYRAAKASTLTAFYTPPAVIKYIYSVLDKLNFKKGNVLEPSCGIGNFFGLLPDNMNKSKIFGVEIDSISARIAQVLYPNNNITISGFEKTNFTDGFFDIAIGNVPFGNFKVNDNRYNALNLSIHDYFFVKTLDLVRPGGIIAFITSKFFFDKKDKFIRKYIAKKADLIGAVRLPDNAFKAAAGTETAMDIIFLQKREYAPEKLPDWVENEKIDGAIYNDYYVKNPTMILGKIEKDSNPYSNGYTCKAFEQRTLEELLTESMTNINGEFLEIERNDTKLKTLPADPDLKNYAFSVINGNIYRKENSVMIECTDISKTGKKRVAELIKLRDCTQKLIDVQLCDDDAFIIRKQQSLLNELYDKFTNRYGLINNRANKTVFSADPSYYLLCSLEILDDEGNFKAKADMFTKRTIKPAKSILRASNAKDAFTVCISEYGSVNFSKISLICNKSLDDVFTELANENIIYKDPVENRWLPAAEYLSGNVKEKLKSANDFAKNDSVYKKNIKALEKVQPAVLSAPEIEAKLGVTWIDKKYIEQFMYDVLQTPDDLKETITISYADYTGNWFINNKTQISGSDIPAYNTYGTSRANAYKILEDTLNLRDVRIYDTVTDEEGKQKRIINKEETMLAAQRQELIKQKFKDWIFDDTGRRQFLVQKYNDLYNSSIPKNYDGKHIKFYGINPAITLRKHQIDAVARILYGGNTLLAHCVGAGKTFTMIAAAMESKRLGMCNKPIFVVPNHLIDQWTTEFMRLYPAANILATTKNDFEKNNRKKFCARIATGNYDAVIIGHSQFGKIPMSYARQKELIEEQIFQIEMSIKSMDTDDTYTVKQMEKMKANLQGKLEKLAANHNKDNVIEFEELGIDRLFIDEAHMYKNLFVYTKMRNVAGLSTTDAQKSSDMFMKCRYIDEITNNKGVIFATGTPVSNSMTELYTMMRYLQYNVLEEKRWLHFDAWAAMFGETITSIELSPEGGYRARTRFAKFSNLPELMRLFKEVADIQTSDMLNLPIPNAHFKTIVAKATAEQEEMVKGLAKRAEKVHNGLVDAREDNMLVITNDGRKLGLDQRLISGILPDDKNSKINQCIENIIRIYKNGNDRKVAQLVFCDLSTPNKNRFNIYDDIKNKLIQNGISDQEIVYIHDANTDTKKKELFAKVRQGKVRILIGSTSKMGAGTNVQDKLIAIHHLDCPWRPSDLEQREGRIIRQGNFNEDVYIYRYVTENTFDAYLYQTIENKQKFISQIMTSKLPVRSCEDVDEAVLSYAEIKALCAGNPYIKEKMNLEVEVKKLNLLYKNYKNQHYRLQDNLSVNLPKDIKNNEIYAAALSHDIEILKQYPTDSFICTINNTKYTDKAEAGHALLAAAKHIIKMQEIGEYKGFKISIYLDEMTGKYKLELKNKVKYYIELSQDIYGNFTKINNKLASIPEKLSNIISQNKKINKQIETIKKELTKTFEYADELRNKSLRLKEVNSLLGI